MDQVFVYGTLKSGMSANGFLDGRVRMGTCTVHGVMLHLGGCPGFVHPDINDGDARWCRVQGEIYKVYPEDLPTLDRYEGVPHLYVRERANTAMGAVWIYVYQRSRFELGESTLMVSNGVWTGDPKSDRVAYSVLKKQFQVLHASNRATGLSPEIKPNLQLPDLTKVIATVETPPLIEAAVPIEPCLKQEVQFGPGLESF